ncbi:MAG: family 20 glycosylhydrolase, partial [Bacteroidales bacterium]
KKQLGLMAFYKFNRMLFHFNDEGGWRVEINAYPKLTDYGAWRPYPNWKEWSTGNRNFCTATDPNATGGFYTKSQLKELTEYANKLNITVIPEINLPRHADAIIAAYPSLSCPAYRGNDKLLCMGNEETYKFLEGVLSELMEMFPSEYMHIGCSDIVDYNPAECPICKERMRSERLSDKEGLKGYFINRIAKFVEKKGRKVICWADAIDDKIPESAWLMSSSRSSINTDKALKMGHNVIMSPDSTCLFSTYQDNLQSELGANDCLSIEKIYDYYPVADGVTSVERDNVGGTEGRLYTQMISTISFAEYMLYPRLLALSEVAWSMPENKSWKRFIVALNKHYKFLKAENVNAKPLSKEVTVKENVNLDKKCIEITFSCNMIPSQIHYTFDGGEPTNNSPEYKSPLSVVDSAVIKFAVFDNGKKVSDTQTFKSYYHKAIGKNVIYRKPYSAYYPANSKTTLTDGYTGGFCSANNCWQGFLGDLDVVVDLGETTSIKEITAQFVRMPDNGIHYPDWVKISISEDGKNYRLIKHIVNNFPCDIPGIDYKNFSFMGNISARYINYQAFRYGDAKDHILTDEIIVK